SRPCSPLLEPVAFLVLNKEAEIFHDTNICQLPMQPGPCQAYVSRYFYNLATKKCEKFRYGGCQGNGNRFATKDECVETCVRPGKRVRELSSQSQGLSYFSPTPEPGPLFALSERLSSFADFPLSSSAVNPVCKLPVDSGSCFSYETRYFYDSVTKKCGAFTYGGCEGNGNRFASIDECLRTCGSAGKRPPAFTSRTKY
uniref:BPTI/Kunitz inhibitor domain-containing protein n=1 Tax=Terrapene triunguis TaxID=2587831 RepID=A0A674J6B1_9SAUR